MAAYKGMSRRIRDALIQVVAAIQYDAGQGPEAAFVNVLPTTSGTFDGYPAVRVLPTDQENERATVKSNQRAPSFSLFLHVPLEDTPEAESAAYDQILDLADLVIDTLTQGDDYVGSQTSPLTAVDSAIGTYVLDVQRGTYNVIDVNGATLVNEIIVQVDYSKDSA